MQACSACVGDLGAIDAKYDIAVSTSCAALDYVVVDNTATAQCCVEMLRCKGLGVATFLILDKQQHLTKALQEKPTPPEGAPLRQPDHSAACFLLCTTAEVSLNSLQCVHLLIWLYRASIARVT